MITVTKIEDSSNASENKVSVVIDQHHELNVISQNTAKLYYVDAGETYVMRFPVSMNLEVGDTIPFKDVIVWNKRKLNYDVV